MQLDEHIKELELELEALVPGDYSYDVVNSELELLYFEQEKVDNSNH